MKKNLIFTLAIVFITTAVFAQRHETIICESENGHRHWCSVDTRGGVRITRQLSRATCTFNRTWGYDSRGIWVRDGCRAEFVVGR